MTLNPEKLSWHFRLFRFSWNIQNKGEAIPKEISFWNYWGIIFFNTAIMIWIISGLISCVVFPFQLIFDDGLRQNIIRFFINNGPMIGFAIVLILVVSAISIGIMEFYERYGSRISQKLKTILNPTISLPKSTEG